VLHVVPTTTLLCFGVISLDQKFVDKRYNLTDAFDTATLLNFHGMLPIECPMNNTEIQSLIKLMSKGEFDNQCNSFHGDTDLG